MRHLSTPTPWLYRWMRIAMLTAAIRTFGSWVRFQHQPEKAFEMGSPPLTVPPTGIFRSNWAWPGGASYGLHLPLASVDCPGHEEVAP